LLTETGTPYKGGNYTFSGGSQTASEAKAANYVCGFLDWMQQTPIPAFYFEAYDEPVKSMNGGHKIEQYFGIMDGDMNIHSFYRDCIPSAPVGFPPVNSTKGIMLYPNPTTDIVLLKTNANIKVYNTQGEILQSLSGNRVDLSAYPQGIYFLQVNGEWAKVVKK
jgi:exo-beta-1,3-glucanase (GH17 family)